jgi:hypothetical protein
MVETIKWLLICSKFNFLAISVEIRPEISIAKYSFNRIIGREVAITSQVQQEGAAIFLKLA